jgi:hypothetical protein
MKINFFFEIKHLNIFFLFRMSAYLAPDPGTPASPDEVKQYIPKPNLSLLQLTLARLT